MKQNDLEQVLEKHLLLGADGFHSCMDKELRKDRHQLLSYLDQCNRVETWLMGVHRRKTVNKRFTSYGLKHRVERSLPQGQDNYVSNGAFIAATLHLGFNCEMRL